MKTLDVLVRPIVTEKAVGKKESDNTLCFQVHPDANKVAEVRTSTFEGKMRRRGRYSGYLADWKKAYVRLKPGQKMPEYAEL
jgi:large subunit ribosomal protein L23